MSTEVQRTCPSCGNEFSGAMQFCPVCMLHEALGGAVASGASSASEDTLKPTTSEKPTHRLEHYEMLTDENSKMSRSQLLFCLRCFFRKTQRNVSRTRPIF
jgi:hypothetical protein